MHGGPPQVLLKGPEGRPPFLERNVLIIPKTPKPTDAPPPILDGTDLREAFFWGPPHVGTNRALRVRRVRRKRDGPWVGEGRSRKRDGVWSGKGRDRRKGPSARGPLFRFKPAEPPPFTPGPVLTGGGGPDVRFTDTPTTGRGVRGNDTTMPRPSQTSREERKDPRADAELPPNRVPNPLTNPIGFGNEGVGGPKNREATFDKQAQIDKVADQNF